MATQSLYRRYRPRRFGEIKGQDHVVRALRNAVIHQREGQAYLFSGPRGTGKTSSARILAKVLNCERPVDGEPCCECASCLAVEAGTSYDVHELDAASNNGVDAMRDLIEKASLGTPGRHRVYILDEVHMLSKAAEAALLKTLEEPPPHVVFVLATTDPQKVSETIRSRTQHLSFHLLPMDVLEEHVRWLAADAGIEIDDAALQSVLERGGGSARDTVSALELVAAGGGSALDEVRLDDLVEAIVDHDAALALTTVAHAIQGGRDARTLTEDLLRLLRDCFLTLMAPDVVQASSTRHGELEHLASRAGAARLVRAMERLGEILVEMRHAPDPRLLVEVALVQLTQPDAVGDLSGLLERIERLEQQAASAPAAATVAAPTNPATGRAVLGGRAGRRAAPTAPSSISAPGTSTSSTSTPGTSTPGTSTPGAGTPGTGTSATDDEHSTTAAAATLSTATASSATPTGEPNPVAPPSDETPATATPAHDAAAMSDAEGGSTAPSVATPSEATATEATAGSAAPSEASAGAADDAAALAAQRWTSDIVPALRGLAKPIFAATVVVSAHGDVLRLGAPNEPHRQRCEDNRAKVESTIAALLDRKVRVEIVVSGDASDDTIGTAAAHETAPRTTSRSRRGGGTHTSGAADDDAAATETRVEEETIDLDDLVDVPPEDVITPVDRLRQAFPGTVEVSE